MYVYVCVCISYLSLCLNVLYPQTVLLEVLYICASTCVYISMLMSSSTYLVSVFAICKLYVPETCTHVCICVFMCVYVYAYEYVRVYACLSTCICMYMCVYVRVYVCICMNMRVYVRVYVCICVFMYVYMYVCSKVL